MTTRIDWCDEVWNPVTGCSKISAGCANCYAERFAKRFWADRKFTDVKLHAERMMQPGRWKEPRKIFVNSMSDLFHEDVPFDFIGDVYDEMICHPKHTFIVLTKRARRMFEFSEWYGLIPEATNVWHLVSVESQQAADERIPYLLKTPAAVRGVSIEPMLEAVDLEYPGYLEGANEEDDIGCRYTAPALDWVICGCESGSNRRPFSMDWARSLRDQCVAADVPFFFKQAQIDGHLVKMPPLDGQVWNQFPVSTKGDAK